VIAGSARLLCYKSSGGSQPMILEAFDRASKRVTRTWIIRSSFSTDSRLGPVPGGLTLFSERSEPPS
jgi:hypothetical protein